MKNSRNMKNSRDFYLNSFQFLEVKFSIYLNRHVFVMHSFQSTLNSSTNVNLKLTKHPKDNAFFIFGFIPLYQQ